jgi:NADH dehydrogenase (ubiquinone) 1 alpha subcomplex subunit 12
MVSLWRTIHNIQRGGWKYWWRNLQYIGDAKYGALKGTDQCVLRQNRNEPCESRWY